MTMRKIRNDEAAFLAAMTKDIPNGLALASELGNCDVEDMDDGGMGSLRFVSARQDRILGRDLVQKQFSDADGVAVIATLSLDNYGEPFELDIWKTDFSPLIRFPA